MPTLARADAIYCSTKCRVMAHRNSIPKELRVLPRWIRYSERKIPLTPWNEIASSTAVHTWSSYEFVEKSQAGVGSGFVFNGDGIIGIDLDDAFIDGVMKPWATKILDSLKPTYVEISPSGRGLHIIGYGQVLRGRRWKFEDGGIEVYGTGRFFTVTGNGMKSHPLKLNKLGDVVAILSPIAEGMSVS